MWAQRSFICLQCFVALHSPGFFFVPASHFDACRSNKRRCCCWRKTCCRCCVVTACERALLLLSRPPRLLFFLLVADAPVLVRALGCAFDGADKNGLISFIFTTCDGLVVVLVALLLLELFIFARFFNNSARLRSLNCCNLTGSTLPFAPRTCSCARCNCSWCFL